MGRQVNLRLLKKNDQFSESYKKILNTFNFNEEDDARGRDFLATLLPAKSFGEVVERIREVLRGKQVIVGGSGPAGPGELASILQGTSTAELQNLAFIAADGACRYFLEQGITPHVIFTDLDGITPELMASLNRKGSIFVIHAHGDNIDAQKRFQAEIRQLNWVIGTTQTTPKSHVINPGGFTDGDRILFFLSHFPAEFEIFLIGMDFGAVIGKFSKPHFQENQPASTMKAKKLAVAIELLTGLLPRMAHFIYRFERSYPFPKVTTLTNPEFREKVSKK